MLTSQIVRCSVVALIGFACMLATEVRAQIAPGLTAPLICNLSLAGAPLTIQAGADGLAFPHDVPCTGGTGTCSEFTYRFTYAGGNISQSFLSVSSDVAIFEASPSGAVEATPCIGDSTTKVGLNVCEQRQVRFNDAATTVNAKVVVTRAAARISTAGARKGNSEAYCLIQGPGVPGDQFAAVSLASEETVAGGKCKAFWTNDPAGKTTGVTTNTQGCFAGSGIVTAAVGGGGSELIQDSGGATITAGTGTSSCKVVSGRSYCVCTAAPCP